MSASERAASDGVPATGTRGAPAAPGDVAAAAAGDAAPAVLTGALFRPLHEQLLQLLGGLSAADWERPTSAGRWRVRDVAAHLLDVDLRRVAVQRDAHRLPSPGFPLESHTALVRHLDALNAAWVDAARRISAPLLVELLAVSGRLVAELMESADPGSAAIFPVAWAGQTAAPMWLDQGRELTERWHHQDQIRAALGTQALAHPELLRPVIEVSLFALPHAYATTRSAAGTRIALEVTGRAGGEWTLLRAADRWLLQKGAAADGECRIRVGDLACARLLLHRLDAADVAAHVEVAGRAELAAPLLTARAVMVPEMTADTEAGS